MSMFDLSGEVAVVIGATGALGGACAQAMGEAGKKISVSAVLSYSNELLDIERGTKQKKTNELKFIEFNEC